MNRYTRCARPAEPENEGDVVVRVNPGCRSVLAHGHHSLYPGLQIFHSSGVSKWPAARPRLGKRNEDGVRVLKIEREKKFSCAELLSLDRAGLMGVRRRFHSRISGSRQPIEAVKVRWGQNHFVLQVGEIEGRRIG